MVMGGRSRWLKMVVHGGLGWSFTVAQGGCSRWLITAGICG